ncbi:MAG TPA: hypothetical protein VFS08_07740 [Gemmatimonadaceae bacterium]|nr:hypothetical protein [Gemmatimonadaceae bacterium]
MLNIRRPRLLTSCLALAIVAAAAGAIGLGRRGPIGRETAQAFAGARQFRGHLVERSRHDPVTARDTASLLALGYLERARLGLGSPFRLVDFVLNDPRLPLPMRDSTAWALLTMVYDGEVYEVDPLALDSLFRHPAANAEGSAAAQLARIERAVRATDDPRVGEQAVRLAYSLAGAEGLLRPAMQLVPARVAAQLRDRVLARADLLRLLHAAREERLDPVRLVPAWRMARRFAVERPILAPLDEAQEVRMMQLVPGLVAELRTAARGVGTVAAAATAAPDDSVLLSPQAGARLAALPQAHALPPQSAVVVALRASEVRVLASDATERVRRSRQRFLDDATTEELLAAHYARLGKGRDRRAAGATLWAAVSLRPFAQEEPWFPGAGGPSSAELRTRFGVAAVSFDRDVPVEWRPYYRRLLATAVEDVRRVLPDLSLDGIGIHFGRQPIRAALAVHDPRTRTIFLPLGTGSGALAHELAHDLDWQVAERRFSHRGQYSTDQAVREQRGRLATSLRGLTSATLVAPGPENQFSPPHSQRPTEVFASSVDWFVAAGLARLGRVDGYLSGVQDAYLTGFADVRPPDAFGSAGEATVEVLAEMTTVPPELEAWFLSEYGRGRAMTAPERAARVLAVAGERTVHVTAASPLAGWEVSPFRQDDALGASRAVPRCVAREVDGDDALRRARRTAAELAADAVARRLVARYGAPVAGVGLVHLDAAGVPTAPVDPDVLAVRQRELRERILRRVERAAEARAWMPTGSAPFYTPYC